jgi:hypothetical protein
MSGDYLDGFEDGWRTALTLVLASKGPECLIAAISCKTSGGNNPVVVQECLDELRKRLDLRRTVHLN